MKILAVIPARYASKRFPGKPLVLIKDRPMVQWVYEAASACPAFSQVIVATDHELIADCVRGFGGQVAMTGDQHETGTDRVAEVASNHPEMAVVANVQGDQPFVTPDMLTRLVNPYLEGKQPEMTTLACPLEDVDNYSNPNVVKVVCDQYGRALYFSRSLIPYQRNPGQAPVFHHLGLYAFRRGFLTQYAKMQPTPLELCEGLEQLRVLEHGYRIVVSQTPFAVPEVNTPEDLELAHSFLNSK